MVGLGYIAELPGNLQMSLYGSVVKLHVKSIIEDTGYQQGANVSCMTHSIWHVTYHASYMTRLRSQNNTRTSSRQSQDQHIKTMTRGISRQDIRILLRAGLTIRGTHTNVRQGPFSHTRSQDFLICGGALFSQKSWRPFLVVFTLFKCTLNVQTSKQRGTNLAADRRGPPGGGGPLPWYNRHNG